MKPDRDRDRMLDEALKQALRAGDVAPATTACLDAETLAAWTDGALDAQAVIMAEAHVSSCARCQALVGTMARTTPAVSAGGDARGVRLWRWWLAPLAASAAAVTLWIVVPGERQSAPAGAAIADSTPVPPPAARTGTAVPPATERDAAARDAARAPVSADAAAPRKGAPYEAGKGAPDAQKESRAADTSTPAESKREVQAPQRQRADKPAESRARSEPPVAEERATVAAAPGVAQLRLQPPAIEIASTDPSRRWRSGDAGAVDYSTDGGNTWEQVSPAVGTDLTAGSAPAPTVCWLVGRSGVVLVTRNGRTFTRAAFPEPVDLVGVKATNDQTATVATADGRTFVTDDSGRTWRRQ